jgi:hypothetical protein
MKGKMFRAKGQGIAGIGSLAQMLLSPVLREGDTIPHHVLVGSIIPAPSGQGITQVLVKKNKNTDFKFLKFNF